jgi:hypothetical protein
LRRRHSRAFQALTLDTTGIGASGSDGLTLTFVEEKGTCSAKFDGKDHPATGPIHDRQ